MNEWINQSASQSINPNEALSLSLVFLAYNSNSSNNNNKHTEVSVNQEKNITKQNVPSTKGLHRGTNSYRKRRRERTGRNRNEPSGKQSLQGTSIGSKASLQAGGSCCCCCWWGGRRTKRWKQDHYDPRTNQNCPNHHRTCSQQRWSLCPTRSE